MSVRYEFAVETNQSAVPGLRWNRAKPWWRPVGRTTVRLCTAGRERNRFARADERSELLSRKKSRGEIREKGRKKDSLSGTGFRSTCRLVEKWGARSVLFMCSGKDRSGCRQVERREANPLWCCRSSGRLDRIRFVVRLRIIWRELSKAGMRGVGSVCFGSKVYCYHLHHTKGTDDRLRIDGCLFDLGAIGGTLHKQTPGRGE